MRAAVFDFDGVIVRSMELHAEAYRQSLRPLGVFLRDDDVFQLEGGRSESVIREFLRRAGRAADSATLARLSQEKQDVFRRLGPPQLYDGADQLVRRVRAKADKLGIVTGTRRENLERLIPTLLPLFDAVLAQDSYSKDKPDPEPYQKSAEALRMDPSQCAALENAPYGVKSARAAGYGLVVAITTTVSEGQLSESGAHAVVPDHASAASPLLRFLDQR